MKKQAKRRQKPVRHSVAHHAVASLVSTAPHLHTGRSLHHRHTSHGVLLFALFLTGILLLSNIGAIRAYGLSSGRAQTIGAKITGYPPSIGADITFPATNTITKASQLQVIGTCEASTLVATYNNGTFAGSSMCTTSGDYSTIIQLYVGANILQSQNYDGLDQAGPVTAQVTITREFVGPSVIASPVTPQTKEPLIAKTALDVAPTIAPVTPAAPAPQPDTNPCFSASKREALISNEPVIIAQCIQRSIFEGQTITIPIQIVGGTAPYVLTIDWGDGLQDLKTVVDTAYHNYEHTYRASGVIGVTLSTTDSKGISSLLHTVVQVNSVATTTPIASTSSFASISAGLNSLWMQAPVPLYWSAVTLVLGFWVGDILQRVSFHKHSTSKKRSSSSKRRNA